MEKKKTLILTIVGVLVLVLAVIGVSFAMYSFTGTGTVDNVIRTGTVSVSYTESKLITLTNEYPMTDVTGSAQSGTGTELEFTVSASMTGAMDINYQVGFDSIVPDTTLTTNYVKFNIIKDNTTYLLSTTATSGILMSSIASRTGTLLTTGYLLDSDTLSSNGDSHIYKIKAWISDQYDLPTTTNSSEEPTNEHTSETTSETITFSIKVVASQV